MKLLHIRLKNLNSLRGEHHLDMETGPLAGAGLFAITGPTGAGKSTLLDAITLALYGRAARYSTANPEDMMSRHTGECEAEVVFAVPQGTYRATWQLKRARSSPEGKLQPAKRTLYRVTGDPGGEPVLATQIRDVEEQIISLTGLHYEQFLRSVLLAQGEFSKFLKAKPDERAALLESLTATGIYSELSALVFTEVRSREQALAATETELGRVVLFTVEERAEQEQTLTESEKRQASLAAEDEKLAKLARAGEELAAQLTRLTDVSTARARLTNAVTAAAPDLASLERDAAATPYFPDLALVETAAAQVLERTRQQAAAAALAETRAAESARLAAQGAAFARQLLAAADTATKKSAAVLTDAEAARKAAADWLETHAADRALTEALPELSSAITNLENAGTAYRTGKQRLDKLTTEAAAATGAARVAQEILTKAEAALAAAAAADALADKVLVERLAGRQAAELQAARDRLTARREALQELDRLTRAAATAANARTAAQATLAGLDAALKTTRAAAESCAERLTSAEKLRDTCEAHLATARQVAQLSEHRHSLADGQPCPLCGSASHPWAADLPASRLPELVRELESARAATTTAAAAARETHTALTRQETEHAGLSARLVTLTGESAAAAEAVAHWPARSGTALPPALPTALAECEEALRAAAADISAFALARDAAVAARTARLEAVSTEKERRAQAISAQEKSAALIRQAAEARDAMEHSLANGKTLSAGLNERLAASGQSRLPEECPAALQRRLTEKCQEFAAREKALAAAAERRTVAQTALAEATSARELLASRCAALRPDILSEASSPTGWETVAAALAAVEAARTSAQETAQGAQSAARSLTEATTAAALAAESLTEKLAGSGFVSVDALRAARLTAERRTVLAARKKAWDEEAVTLTERERTCHAAAEALRSAGAPEGEARATLTDTMTALREDLASLRRTVEERRFALRQDSERREFQSQRTAELAETRSRLVVWRRLNGIIGSGNGAKFRKFAQGISLDLLLHRANQHLVRLTDRYRMRRGEDELEIVIEDLFQAATRRPMASLSGGESFLVSLALALGLSDLAGRNVQIDSLFIDEGFGTLDAATLDMAITALETLRLDRKTIGIISHVSLLTERISTRVVVEKLASGVSRLLSPGTPSGCATTVQKSETPT